VLEAIFDELDLNTSTEVARHSACTERRRLGWGVFGKAWSWFDDNVIDPICDRIGCDLDSLISDEKPFNFGIIKMNEELELEAVSETGDALDITAHFGVDVCINGRVIISLGFPTIAEIKVNTKWSFGASLTAPAGFGQEFSKNPYTIWSGPKYERPIMVWLIPVLIYGSCCVLGLDE